ncbi:MAG: D-alanyl-D-alanine carboxypeptidase/D-alanyl-D-alanine-endopeptidase [Gemmataceae bacterium]|nr:D-alanyl-D-alanine carboxypeptidase/D-alanyl-D-alanine-endopeptidase [Gemmataceae bacterium]
MLRLRPVLWIFGLLLLPSAPLRADTDLAGKIGAVIHGPDYRHARWGLLVVDAQSGQTVYAHNPDQLFIPASTTKLFSCAAALLALGPNHRFETPVYRRGTVVEGRLEGDLILVAQGDLTLGGRTDAEGRIAFRNSDHTYAGGPTSRAELTPTDPLAGLKALARQVAAAGIRQVQGEVLVDDRLFARARGSGSGPDLLTPIVVNDNVLDLVITPAAKAGELATVQLRPPTSFVQMDAQVETVAEGKRPALQIRAGQGNSFSVRGQILLSSPPRIAVYPVTDPAGFARALFIETLRQEGVRVSANPLQPPAVPLPEQDRYSQWTRVAVYSSPPLSEVIKVTLKVSHNLYASTLPLLIAAKHGKRTLAEGLQLQGRFLADLGVDRSSISFAGAAGGERADAVTPRATVQLLQAMAKRSEYAAFHAGLPVLGVDGTLADVVAAESPARGRVHAKTGTLSYEDRLNARTLLTSKALAGTMTTAGGRSLVFAMFVNNVPLPKGVTSTREGKVLGRLCEILYQH